MVGNLFLLLGLPRDASFVEVKKQYLRLSNILESAERHARDVRTESRICRARQRLSVAYEQAKSIEVQRAYNGDYTSKSSSWQNKIKPHSRPKLGQLLVASGVISLEQLDQALEIQQTSKPQIPLGTILVSWKYLTKEELGQYLLLQDVITLEPDNSERVSLQLLQLGLVTEDQLAIARLDQHTHKITLLQALVKRNWLEQAIAENLASKPKNQNITTTGDSPDMVWMSA